jgi:hypothetical protein
MVRNVDYETRRRAVLEAAINKYIKDAIPVASEDIASEFHRWIYWRIKRSALQRNTKER